MPYSRLVYTIEKLPDEPIIIQTIRSDSSATEVPDSMSTMRELLESADTALFVIYDVSHASFGVQDILSGSNEASRSERPLLKHPNIRETLVVSTSDLVKMAARGMNSPIFGNIALKVFDTLEEALTYCRHQQQT
jgi:hypothetical protein